MNLETDILNTLLDIYERSKVSKGQNKVHKDIKLDITHSVFDKHRNNDNELEITLKRIERDGFARIVYTRDGQFQCLILNINTDSINNLYKKLKRKNPNQTIIEYIESLEMIERQSLIVSNFVSAMLRLLDDKKLSSVEQYATSPKDLMDICLAINEMDKLEEDVPERVFCAKLFSNSKRFNELRGKITKIIKEFSDEPFDDEEDVIAHMGVVKNTSYAFIKGDLIVNINNQQINLRDYGEPLALSDSAIKALEIVKVNAVNLFTIENLTSFDIFDEPNSIAIYLAGFHNRIKRQLVLKICQAIPNIKCFHYGDIDAGGFYILNHLREKTDIHFNPYMMDIGILEKYKNNCKPLTNNDKKRLNLLLENDAFKEFVPVIKYMLENNIKLEQEAEN